MARVIQSAQARLDIIEIWAYIAADRITAADKLLDQFTARFKLLATTPMQGEAVSYIRPGVRRTAVGNYVIYFQPVDDGIEVIRVLHGARQHEGLL